MLSGGVLELDAITVTATRTEEPAYGALSPSSVWTRGELQPLQPDGVADVLDLVPSVNTQTTPNDPGAAVSIRGLQDFGRVNVMVDGARQNFQKSGHGANGTFYFDTEMLKAVDVTRGPSATVYGSGAIGGVVNFTTLDADDVLDDDETVALRLKMTVETNAPSFLAHGEAAARLSDSVDVVGAATWRDAGDYKAGGGETINSAQDLISGLAKARFRPSDAHDVTLSALHYDSRSTTRWSRPRPARRSPTPSLSATASRPTPISPTSRPRSTTPPPSSPMTTRSGGSESYEIGTVGLDLFNTSRFETGAVSHALTYGVDAFHDRVDTSDPNGSSDDLTPSGERVVYGAFIQDRAAFTEWLELIGALRFDGYRLSGSGIVNEGSRLSPKLTVGITPFDPVTFYATYAEGYRAPSITETLIDGFHPPPVSTGRFIPNPDLKPEVAHSLEGGVNIHKDGLFRADDQLRIKLGVFRNQVDDYIEQQFEMFPIPGGYQYQNVANATLEGVELEAGYDAGFAFASFSGQVMRGVDDRPTRSWQAFRPTGSSPSSASAPSTGRSRPAPR